MSWSYQPLLQGSAQLGSVTPLVETLVDDFDDNSTNSTLWGGAYSSSATYAETGGQLEITLSSGGVNYAGYVSTDVYDLTESSIYVKVPTMCNTATTAEAIFTLHNSANTNKVEIMQEQGTLYFRHVISGSATNLASVTYNGSTHLWWRISETGGTVYWDTSTDGSSWTNRYSESTPIDITALEVELSAGTYAVVASPGTVAFDNLNVTSSVNTTVTPDTASLTTTTFAPTVTTTDNKFVTTASPTALTITTFAPTVSVTADVSVTPNTASLALTTYAPTVTATDNKTVTPGTASLTTTTYAPTVSVTDNKIVTPGTASLTLTTYAPTVDASSGSIVLTPGVINMITTMFAPTVTVSDNKYVTPGVAHLRLKTYAPIINGIVPTRDYYIDSSGNIYWVTNQEIGLVEKV